MYMDKCIKTKILNKIFDNYNFSIKKGMIIASPSIDPPYKFHWIRDAALVMRVIISEYTLKKQDRYLIAILNYIENEYDIQKLDTITGLGEPKINIDCTPYNEPWGRPQNDGPALRCINLIQIYQLIKNDYKNITENILVKMIEKDINYIIKNINNIAFDLWEEIKGWHFYTRLVQLKCIKDYISLKNEFDNYFTIDPDINKIYNTFIENIKDHIDSSGGYISSFDIDGNVIRKDDASIILAFCHISFDKEILSELPVENVLHNSNNLLHFFRNKYQRNDINLIGRYQNDKYFDGQLWVLCSLALGQFFIYLKNNYHDKYSYLDKSIFDIYSQIVSIDENLNLPEQFDVNNQKFSAQKLTWNYSEFYFYLSF